MRKDIRLQRVKVNGYWVTVWIRNFDLHYWIGSICINKSMRATNDWYNNRKKLSNQSHAPANTLFAAMRLWKKLVFGLKQKATIVLYQDTVKHEAIARYLERIGFRKTHDGSQSCWMKVIRPEAAE